MKKSSTELVMILDRSGSMVSIWNDAVGGMKSYIEEQKKVSGEAHLTMVLFDDPPFDTIFDRVNIREVDSSRLNSFSPRGTTALLKAISDTVDSVSLKLSLLNEEDRPERVLVVVMTDGQENASNTITNQDYQFQPVSNVPQGGFLPPVGSPNVPLYPKELEQPMYTREKLKVKLDAKRNDKWEIIFLGADESAFSEGASMGTSSSFKYDKTSKGIGVAYAALSMATVGYRSTGVVDDSSLKNMT